MIQVPAAAALVLCIIGATNADTPAEISTQPLFRAGLVLFLVVFIALLVLTIGAALGQRRTQRGEKTLLSAVAISLPLIMVRIIYSLVVSFSGNEKFASSTTAGLFMSTIEEMVVVLVYLWAGLLTSSVPDVDTKTGPEKLVHRAGRGDFNGGRLGLVSLGAAIVSIVVSDKSEKGKQSGFEDGEDSV
jgi:surface polysaccharide O-acyltransferase-like enzyme